MTHPKDSTTERAAATRRVQCAAEVFLGNGLQASLISAAFAVPIVGLLNFGFGWLRRPLNADLMTKSGETLEALEAKEAGEKEAKQLEAEAEAAAAEAVEVDEKDTEEKVNETQMETGSNGVAKTTKKKTTNKAHELELFDQKVDMDKHVHKKGVVRSRRTHVCDLCKARRGGDDQPAGCLGRCARNTFVSKPLECVNCIVVQGKCVASSGVAVCRGLSRCFCGFARCCCTPMQL
eukprot:SAG22_NODE_178_length_16142_cov_13.187995_13_plen_235_part_00